MSPRLLVLPFAAIFTLGCNAATPPTAQADAVTPREVELTPMAAPAPAVAVAPEIALAAESETTAERSASAAPEPAPEAVIAAEPASAAAPAPVEVEVPAASSQPAPASAAATVRVDDPASAAAPARFATTQATTAPVAVQPIVVIPTTTPAADLAAAQTLSSADHFDAQLAALINEEPASAAAAPGVAQEDQTLIRSVVDSLADFRGTLRNENALRQAKVAPLLELSEKIRSEIPLSLPTLALCRSVQQFGVYDPFDPPRFTAGRETPVVIYCEVDHFRSAAADDGGWETKLNYEAVLYSDTEAAVPVITKKPTPIVDRCRNRRRDFFLADRMTLPANLPVGKYVLKVTVIDQLANRVAEKTVSVLVAPN